MEQSCGLMLDELSVLRLLENAKDAQVVKVYTKLAAKALVRDMKGLRPCSATDCEFVLRADLILAREVECKCGNRFCFACGLNYHRPASCGVMKRWEQKQSLEGENLAFLSKNTKSCPKCASLIYKDQGCQYIRCLQCSHNFCWICLTNVDHKAHTCNKFPNKAEKGSDRNEWNRYTFYYERFKGHADTVKYEAKLQAKAEQIMKQLTVSGMNWIDAQFIKTAVQVLKNARAVLAVSYVMGYFLDSNTHLELFENYQAFLEEATERLSQVLEAKEDLTSQEKRLEVINLTENLKVRADNFVAAVEDSAFAAVDGYKAEEKEYEIEATYEGWIYNAGN